MAQDEETGAAQDGETDAAHDIHDGLPGFHPAVLDWVEPKHEPLRILFVFAWLVVGGEETEVRLLARTLDPGRYHIDVVACFRKEGMPEQTHEQLRALGVDVDTVPYHLSFEDTVAYLASKVVGYDAVVACQNVPDIYPALERLRLRPPLIEHGGLVSEALAGPKHLTTRYLGVCRTIRDAAAARMPGREAHALEIPSMVDLTEFDPARRPATRTVLGISDAVPLIGWVGRLDAKKRVEDFIDAAALVARQQPDTRFLVIGGPDAFMPDYAEALHARAKQLGLDGTLRFLGDRTDVPDLLAALDVFVWLSRGEGMPHVVAEAGAAGLPVIATRDNGTLQQIAHEETGLFVAHEDPNGVAAAMLRLLGDTGLRQRLGKALRAKVERDYGARAVARQWADLFDTVVAERRLAQTRPAPLFRNPFLGGFESSSHRRGHDGARLDMLALTRHDACAAEDYRTLQALGILTVRDALRWHLIETMPGRYEWSSLDGQLEASRRTGMQVIWDLMHYGWPDDIDIWGTGFASRFADYAAAAARHIATRTDGPPLLAPINEISFFAWAGGDVGYFNPFGHGRGLELKAQLCRAAILGMDAIRSVVPGARFVHVDPVINIVADKRAKDMLAVEGYRTAQFQAWDMLSGAAWPQLGGRPDLLDIVGINYYHDNQWTHDGPPLDIGHPRYRPLRALLAETFDRYGRPIFVAETGIEGRARPNWLAYVCAEVRAAIALGVPVEGVLPLPRPRPSGLGRRALLPERASPARARCLPQTRLRSLGA